MCNSPSGSSLGACHCVPLSTRPSRCPQFAPCPPVATRAGMLRDVCCYTSKGCWRAGPGPPGLERLAAVCHRLRPPKYSLDSILVLLAAETVSCSVLTHVSRSGAFGLTNAGLCTPRVYCRVDQEPMWRLGFHRAGQKKRGGGVSCLLLHGF